METEEDQEIDELLAEAAKEVTEVSNTAKLEEMQAAMEAQYQQRIMEERQRMQQFFSEQFINLAKANYDPYMQQEGVTLTPEAEDGKDATCLQSESGYLTISATRREGQADDGTTDGRGTSDGPAASGYRTRGFLVTDTCATRTSANGAVMYNWERCETRGEVGTIGFAKMLIAQHERLVVFVLMILGELMAFAATFLWLSWKDGVQGKDSIKISNHRYFCRRRMRGLRHNRRGIFFIVLICQQHVIQGGTLVGSAGSEDFSTTFHHSQFQSGASSEQEISDWVNLMTRQERANDFRSPPSPRSVRDYNTQVARSEGGDFSPGQESEGDYYQMAFIFQLGLPPISRRLTWDVYWTMHRQIANACGIGIDDLVGIHHVRHQPADLEELEVQSVIAQRVEEVQHGSWTIMALTDVERHQVRGDLVPVTVRDVHNIRKFITRRGILDTLGVNDECSNADRPCIIWKNDEPWKEQDLGVKEMHHGDYVRCALPPGQEGDCAEEVDDVNLVQLHASTQTEDPANARPDAFDIEIFGLGRDFILLDDVSPDIRSIVLELERIWEIPTDDVETLHEVRDPPIHRQRALTISARNESRQTEQRYAR